MSKFTTSTHSHERFCTCPDFAGEDPACPRHGRAGARSAGCMIGLIAIALGMAMIVLSLALDTAVIGLLGFGLLFLVAVGIDGVWRHS